MINILANRFKFTQKVGVFIKTDYKSEKEIFNFLDKYDWNSSFLFRAHVFIRPLREELFDE